MSRWLTATLLLASALAAGTVAFLNAGDPLPVRVTPTRQVALSLGMALAIAFAAGAAVVAAIAGAGALARAWRSWRMRRTTARTAAKLARERVRAETLLVAGDADAARTRLAEAVTSHGPDERLLELLAGASERSGDVPGAIAAVEEARRRLPDSPRLARRLVALYGTAGRWEDALAVETDLLLSLRSADALGAETATYCGLRYEAACADPDPGRAVRRLLALAREHPAFVPAWVAAGDRLRAAGRAFRARRVLERGARVRPARVLLDCLFAAYAEANRRDRALAALRRIQARHPGDAAVVASLARRHLDDGTLDEADALLASWPTEAPAAISALRGELCRRQGRPEQALVHFARAAARHLAAADQRCRACGTSAPQWTARCAACGRWDTIVSEDEVGEPSASADLMAVPSRSTATDHCVHDATG